MSHEIDLSGFEIRCDLISDEIANNKIDNLIVNKKIYKNIVIEEIVVDYTNCKLFNKKEGVYITIHFSDITDFDNRNDVIKIVSKSLKTILMKKNLIGKKVLVIGLGNSFSTPDALGPKTIDNIIVTRHLFELNEIDVEEGYSNVSVVCPGVFANTGVESSDVVFGIVDRIKPDYMIVIDSLASSTLENVNRIIQITDAGIAPGSGIGNNRKEISQDIFSIPVIAIGVPTVVDAVTIVNDTLKFLMKKISYNIFNVDNVKNKLVDPNNVNYLGLGYNLDREERKKFLGLLGELDDEEMKDLINEVLTPIGYNFMVTPKEVDFIIEKLSVVISKAINSVLHNKVSNLNN